MGHFNWLQYFFNIDHHYTHVLTAIVITGLILVLGIVARIQLGSGEASIEPAARFSVRGFFELITESFYGLADQIIGHDGAKYVPLAASIFTFVLINNLIGLLPGMTPATDNLNTSFAIGVFSFVYYNYIGLKYEGMNYLKHFLGPVWWLAWLILPIELISHAFRPLTLGLRLAGNITADHTVLSVFHQLQPWFVPIPFYAMGLIVSLLQAFVFALLTLVYVMLAKAHDH
ncbi:MAG: F0F1 ATP synthase subunit A [Bdellovibrionaceae bacterium]|nr:F0F1 ATP synthase subunit A [Pseudobdellovibrionaceae bacterium]